MGERENDEHLYLSYSLLSQACNGQEAERERETEREECAFIIFIVYYFTVYHNTEAWALEGGRG